MTPARAAALAATLVYLAFVIPQVNRPLMYDDANFALAARAVADTGQPYGNQGWMSERGDFSQREQWALWHPPLYIYLLGLADRLLEERDRVDVGCTARLRGAGCVEVEIRLGSATRTRRYSTEGIALLVDPAGMLGLELGEAIDRLAGLP